MDSSQFKFQNYHFESNDPNVTITSVTSTQSAYDGTDTLPIVRNSRPTENRQRAIKQGRPTALSLYAAIFLTVNTALGAGLFNLPSVFYKSGGFFISTGIQLVILVFIIGSLILLSYLTDKYHARTYHELVDKALGPFWNAVCSYSLILYSYGCCLTFLLLIEDQFKTAFASYFGSDYEHFWYMNTMFTTSVCAVIFILPLCFSSKLDFLKYPSSCGVLIIGYILWMIFYYMQHAGHIHPVDAYHLESWTDIFLSIPAICFSYQCHINWVPTFSEMNCRTRSYKTLFTVMISTIICFLCYTFVCYAGIATFGGQYLDTDLIRNYDAQNPFVLIGILGFAFKIVVTYPIVLYCAREAILDQLQKFTNSTNNLYANYSSPSPVNAQSEAQDLEQTQNSQVSSTTAFTNNSESSQLDNCLATKQRRKRQLLITFIWFFTCLLIAVVTPDIGYVINLLGTLAVLFMFILPGLCLIKIVTSRDPYVDKPKSYALFAIATVYIVIGAFIFGFTLVQSVQTIINHNGHSLSDLHHTKHA